MGLVCIIIIFVLALTIKRNKSEIEELNNKIKKLVEENKNLKSIISRIKDGSLKPDDIVEKVRVQGQPQNAPVQQTVAQVQPQNVQMQQSIQTQQRVEPKKEIDKDKIKNTTILLTGAFLIILAAIILLLSTWDMMPNFMKTVVLFMFAGLFIGISKKADSMGLKDTSRTFFNLAMAYMPICFISISLFGLLGEYLSISGDGKFIYLTAVFLAISGVYYKFSKVKDSKGLYYSSILSQLFTVVLFSLIFENNINLVLLNVCLYNLVLLIVPERNEMVDLVNIILSYIGLVMGFFIAVIGNTTLITVLAAMAIFAGFAVITKRNPSIVNGASLNISIIAIILAVIGIEKLALNVSFKVLMTLIGMFASLIIEENLLSNKKYKEVKYTNYILGHIVLIFTWLISLEYFEESIVRPYVIALLITGLSTITYLKYKKGIFAVLMPISFTVFAVMILENFDVNLSYHMIVIPAIAQFVIFKFFAAIHKDSRKWIESTINVILIFVMTSAFEAYSECIMNGLGYFLLIFALYGYSEYTAKSKVEEGIYRVLTYCSAFFVLGSFFGLIFEDADVIMSYIPLILSFVAIILENMYGKFNDGLNKFIRNGLAVFACVTIGDCDGFIHGMMIGFTGIATLLYNRYKKEKMVYDLPIMILSWWIITFRDPDEELLKMVLMMIYTVYSTVMTITNRKINFYSIMSYIYLFSFMVLCENIYVNILLVLINSLVCIPYMEKNRDADLFKFLSCAAGLSFYLNFVDEFVTLNYASIKFVGWLLLSIYTHNKILNKYIKNSKALRIITYIIVYWAVTVDAYEMIDKMLVMFIEVMVILYSYKERLEAEFISTIAMLIIQAFLLTASFWFGIPWWIYLVIIGGTLISFGIRNESKEKGNNSLKEMYNNRFKK